MTLPAGNLPCPHLQEHLLRVCSGSRISPSKMCLSAYMHPHFTQAQTGAHSSPGFPLPSAHIQPQASPAGPSATPESTLGCCVPSCCSSKLRMSVGVSRHLHQPLPDAAPAPAGTAAAGQCQRCGAAGAGHGHRPRFESSMPYRLLLGLHSEQFRELLSNQSEVVLQESGTVLPSSTSSSGGEGSGGESVTLHVPGFSTHRVMEALALSPAPSLDGIRMTMQPPPSSLFAPASCKMQHDSPA